jgi:hypothetical protein
MPNDLWRSTLGQVVRTYQDEYQDGYIVSKPTICIFLFINAPR